jgi:hypothetical protein
MLNVLVLSVAFFYCYAECRYAEYNYTDCRSAGCGTILLFLVQAPAVRLEPSTSGQRANSSTTALPMLASLAMPEIQAKGKYQ